MSNALLSSLPRFDRDDDAQERSGQLQLLLGKTPARAPSPPPEPEIEEPEPPPQIDPGPSLEEVEALIAGLSGAMKQMEQDSRAQATQVIQSLAARLFPELSRQFLAEEIGNHMERLVPPSVPSVEIRARAPMLEKLDSMVARTPSLSGRCTLVPVETPDESRVLVSWKTGGVTFDFQGLLEACLAHLDPAQTLIEE